MRKLIAAILAVVLFASSAWAGGKYVVSRRLEISGTPITGYSLTSGVAVTSDSVKVSSNEGYMSVLVKEAIQGGAGDVDIYAMYSLDNTNFYRANTTSSGSLTEDANIVTTLQNSTKWIVIPSRIARYVKFVFDPDANSQITADVIYLEGN